MYREQCTGIKSFKSSQFVGKHFPVLDFVRAPVESHFLKFYTNWMSGHYCVAVLRQHNLMNHNVMYSICVVKLISLLQKSGGPKAGLF